MLFNPRHDPYNATIDDLIKFLETKNKHKKYTYGDPQECLLCKFLVSRGIADLVTDSNWGAMSEYLKTRVRRLPEHFDHISRGDDIHGRHTYGAALKRARRVKEAHAH
jgi:hypothetical protein